MTEGERLGPVRRAVDLHRGCRFSVVPLKRSSNFTLTTQSLENK